MTRWDLGTNTATARYFHVFHYFVSFFFANYAHSLASFRRIPGTMATRRRRIPHTKNKSFARRKRSPDAQHAKIRLVR